MSLRNRIVGGTKAMLLAQVARVGAKGAVVVLLTRTFLEPGEYGLLFLAVSVLGVATLFANLGLAKSAGRFLAEYRERDPGQVPTILGVALKANLATIAVVGAVLLVSADRVGTALNEPALTPLLLLGVAYVGALSLKTFAALAFQGFGRVGYSALVAVVANVGVLGFVVAFLVAGFGTLGALAGYVAGYALAAAVGLGILYVAFYRPSPRDDPEGGLARRVLEYSVPLTATRGANVLDKRVDAILVGHFLSPVAVGFYTLGKQVADFAVAPAASLGFSVAPTYGEHKAGGDLRRAARVYETTVEYTLALYVPAAVGLFLVARPLVVLVFGADYAGAVPVLQAFSLYVLLQAVDKITNDSLDFLGKARARAYAKGGTSVANFGLNLVLIPAFGVVGAAAATVATYSCLVGVELGIVYRELPVDARSLVRTGGLIAAIAGGMGAVVYALVPHVETLPALGGVVLAGVGVWATLAVLTGLLDVEDVRTVVTGTG